MSSYFFVYNEIFSSSLSSPVSGPAKAVYAYLCLRADRDGCSYPAQATIAKSCGMGVSTVKKGLAELEAAELISVRGQAAANGKRCANLYTVNKDFAKNGYFKVYSDVFRDGLSAKARAVYMYICRLSGGSGSAFPSHKAVMSACALSKLTAREAVDELEAARLITRQAQFRKDGGQRANIYTLVFVADGQEVGGTSGGMTNACITNVGAINSFIVGTATEVTEDAEESGVTEVTPETALYSPPQTPEHTEDTYVRPQEVYTDNIPQEVCTDNIPRPRRTLPCAVVAVLVFIAAYISSFVAPPPYGSVSSQIRRSAVVSEASEVCSSTNNAIYTSLSPLKARTSYFFADFRAPPTVEYGHPRGT